MAIIPQPRLFEWKEIEELKDLDRLRLVLEYLPDEELMRILERERGNGRDDYPVRAMWNSVLAGLVFQHASIKSLRRELSQPWIGYFKFQQFSGKILFLETGRTTHSNHVAVINKGNIMTVFRLRSTIFQNISPVHECNLVASFGFIHVGSRNKYGNSLAEKIINDFPKFSPRNRVYPGGRFIQKR